MDDSEKRPYQKQADKDKRRYQKAMKTYVPPRSPRAARRGRRRTPTPPSAPARLHVLHAGAPPAACEEAPRLAFWTVWKVIGEEWRELSASKKSKFERMSQKDRARYEREMTEVEGQGTLSSTLNVKRYAIICIVTNLSPLPRTLLLRDVHNTPYS